MKYHVYQIANGHDSTAPGYAQAFEAYVDDDFAGGEYGEGHATRGFTVTVQHRQIEAESATEAIAVFKQWLFSGHNNETRNNP